MPPIPRPALLLGLAGTLPFLWGALTSVQPGLAEWGSDLLGPRFVGPYVQVFYGAIILAFMSGVLWGFATKAEGWSGYVLSVIPALWAFFTTGGGAERAAGALIVGFVGLLALDWVFWKRGLAPQWWMGLRVLLTLIVVNALAVDLIF